MGILAAVKNNSAVDSAATMTALWGRSIPNFWLGIMLILLFSVEWRLLPASGFVSPAESLSRNLATLIRRAGVPAKRLVRVVLKDGSHSSAIRPIDQHIRRSSQH